MPSGAVIDHRLNNLDRNYALTATGIGVSYIFDKLINLTRLQSSLKQLLAEVPVLAGRANFKTMRVESNKAHVPIEIVEAFKGCAQDYAASSTNIRNRADFVLEPPLKKVRKGQSQIMCVRVTQFSTGGCALGVTLNHGVVDAAGFHLIMKRWSEIFSGLEGRPVVMDKEVFNFETDRSAETLLDDIERTGNKRPQNYGNFTGRLLKLLIYKVVDVLKKRDREMVHLSPVQIDNIRETVRREAGLERLSRNIAMSAHIIHALIPLQTRQDETRIKVANVINIRSRIRGPFAEQQASYAGNAILLMMCQLSHKASVRHLGRGEIARALYYEFNGLTEANIWRDMRNVLDSLNADYGYPGVNTKGAVMGINNQSKFDVYGVDFGAGRPLRVIPQEVGDHIMMFPAADGGMEIYMRDFASRKRQKKLLESEWLDKFTEASPVQVPRRVIAA